MPTKHWKRAKVKKIQSMEMEKPKMEREMWHFFSVENTVNMSGRRANITIIIIIILISPIT